MTVTIQRRGGAFLVRVVDGGRVGEFRNQKRALEFTRRVLGEFQIQEEFNLQLTTQPTTDKQSARGAGPGRALTVSYDSDQDRRAPTSTL